MGILPEQKLIVKHTFLEYVFEQIPLDGKPLRQRSKTEPVIASDLLYSDVRELFHDSDYSTCTSDAMEEPDHMQATPEATPLRLPSYDALLTENVPLLDCLPAAYEYSTWQCFSEQYWLPQPIPYDVNMGIFTQGFAAADANVMESDDEDATKETRTSVMLRGLPDTCTRAELLHLLSTEGFFGRFNFLYLPVDFKRGTNLGYALVNLVSSTEALRLRRHFEGFFSWDVPSDNICSVTWCNPQQGLDAHVERYRNSPVMHASVPEEWRPLLLSHGVPITFPAPTTKIKAPKLKAGR